MEPQLELVLPPNVRVSTQLARDDAGYSIADEASVRALSAAEDAHFWHVTRNRFIQRRLGVLGMTPSTRILELGCGGGAVTAHLSRCGYDVMGVDGHLDRILEAAVRAPSATFLVHDLSRGPVPVDGGLGFDAVGLFDVIEHLDAPAMALQQAIELTRPGGVVVGTVPALMALWSQVDEHAGHRLRYDRGTLMETLARVEGATIEEVIDFNRHLVPLMWLQRKVVASDDRAATAEANFRVPPKWLNNVMLALANLERLFDGMRVPVPGASLWFALRRTRPLQPNPHEPKVHSDAKEVVP